MVLSLLLKDLGQKKRVVRKILARFVRVRVRVGVRMMKVKMARTKMVRVWSLKS
jgi:hypothetical protein